MPVILEKEVNWRVLVDLEERWKKPQPAEGDGKKHANLKTQLWEAQELQVSGTTENGGQTGEA